jgi:hypothetical protein
MCLCAHATRVQGGIGGVLDGRLRARLVGDACLRSTRGLDWLNAYVLMTRARSWRTQLPTAVCPVTSRHTRSLEGGRATSERDRKMAIYIYIYIYTYIYIDNYKIVVVLHIFLVGGLGGQVGAVT